MKFFLSSLLFLTFYSLGFAQDLSYRLSNEQIKIMSRDQEVAGLLFKLGDHFKSFDGIPVIDEEMIKDLEKAGTEILQKAYAENPEEKRIIKKISNLIRWDNIYHQAKKISPYVKNFSRYKGMSAAILLLVLGPSDIYFPLIAMALNKPELIPILTIPPYMMMGLAVDSILRNYYTKQRIAESLGGKEAFKIFESQKKKAILEMGLKHDDYFHPLNFEDGELEALIVKRRNFFQKHFSFLGIKTDALDYSSFKKFIADYDFLKEDKVILNILSNTQFPEETRVAMSFEYLYRAGDDEVIEHLNEQFGNSILKFKYKIGANDIWQVYKDLRSAQTIKEIRQIILAAPETISPQSLAEIWRFKLTEIWSENLGELDYFEFRRLMKSSDSLYGAIQNKEASSIFDLKTKKQFINVLDNLKTSKNKCLDALETI